LERKLEKYNEIVEAGCFYCSSASGILDYDHDHCIDICAYDSNESSLVKVGEW